jgi:anaerobic dimethyl sulfoxide reductase subunit A
LTPVRLRAILTARRPTAALAAFLVFLPLSHIQVTIAVTPPADERILPITCNRDCGGGCPLLAVVRHGRLAAVRDNPLAGPHIRGCVRGYQLARVIEAPDRLVKPLLRVGPRGSGAFREISWSEALERVADGLMRVHARHGAAAIMPLGGSGSCRGALHNTESLPLRFLALLGGYTGTYGSYSSGAASYTTPFVLGDAPSGIDAATLQYSRLILLGGANVEDCRLGCELGSRVRQARDRGVPVIVIDPRRTRTVSRLGTEWIPVRPGTDAALMLGVLHVLVTEGLIDRPFIARMSVGFDRLECHVLGQDGTPPKTPTWAAAICGVPADTIINLARRYAAARPTALIPGLSIQRTIGGEEAIRLAIALQVATGNIGIRGGSSGGLVWSRLPDPQVGTLPVPANPAGLGVPVYQWADAILGGRAGGFPSDIHAVYNVGGNYVVQGADTTKSARAFHTLEFAVCHDLFLTPTARHCDVVLPVAASPERADIVLTGANMLLYSHRAVEPPPGVMTDYEVFCALAARLGLEPAFSQGRTADDWLATFVEASEIRDVETFQRTGIYWGRDRLRVGLADFVADPQAHPLSTPSGRIEVASDALRRGGFSPVPTARCLLPEPEQPLYLVTPKSRYRVHSQHSNIPWFREREEQALWIHPDTAATRGIADGDLVLVRNARGRVRVPARVTPDIMPDVVCLLEGVWPEVMPDGTDVAGSANMLTDTTPTLPSASSRTHSVLVQVETVATPVSR